MVTQAGVPPFWGGTACAPHEGNGEVDREQKTHTELPVRVLQAIRGPRGQVGGDLKGTPTATESRLKREGWRGTGWAGSSAWGGRAAPREGGPREEPQAPAVRGKAPRCEAMFLSLCSSPVNPAPREGQWTRH